MYQQQQQHAAQQYLQPNANPHQITAPNHMQGNSSSARFQNNGETSSPTPSAASAAFVAPNTAPQPAQTFLPNMQKTMMDLMQLMMKSCESAQQTTQPGFQGNNGSPQFVTENPPPQNPPLQTYPSPQQNWEKLQAQLTVPEQQQVLTVPPNQQAKTPPPENAWTEQFFQENVSPCKTVPTPSSTPKPTTSRYQPILPKKQPPVLPSGKRRPGNIEQTDCPPPKKMFSPTRIPTSSSKQRATCSKQLFKDKAYVEKDFTQPLSPKSVSLLDRGLKENHDRCERDGVIIEATPGPDGENPSETFQNFVALRHWGNHFKMSPLATAQQLMVMGNMFEFFLQSFNKMKTSIFKLMIDMGRAKKQSLSAEQERDVQAIANFLNRLDNDQDFCELDEEIDEEDVVETLFQQKCNNCPIHKCGEFENVMQTGEESSDDENDDYSCTMCPVHKCVSKFNVTTWNFGGRPNQGKTSEKKQRKPAVSKELTDTQKVNKRRKTAAATEL